MLASPALYLRAALAAASAAVLRVSQLRLDRARSLRAQGETGRLTSLNAVPDLILIGSCAPGGTRGSLAVSGPMAAVSSP